MYTSPNPSHVLGRDLPGDVANVRNTFSSWDSCMAQDYCKYPVIVAIIVGSLILISVIWCCTRCLCCGAECCCACCSCFNACCPSPRNKKNEGYQKPQQQPYPYPYNQYQSPQPPVYFGAGGAGGGHQAPQTATFDAPSRKNYNEDALPAMPSWDTATSRRVEEEPSEVEIEMDKLDQQSHSSQNQSLLPKQQEESAEYEDHYAGDIGAMPAGGPYTDYGAQQQSNSMTGGYTGSNMAGAQQQRANMTGGYNGNNMIGGVNGSNMHGGFNGNNPAGGYNGSNVTGNYNGSNVTGNYNGNNMAGAYNSPSPYQQNTATGNYNSSNVQDGPYQSPTSPHSPHSANPYYDFSQQNQQQQQKQYFGSPTSPTGGAPSIYPPTYHTRAPSSPYSERSYGPPPPSNLHNPQASLAAASPPPGSHARMPSAGSFVPGRKPVAGAWNDV